MTYRVFVQNSDASEKWELPFSTFSFTEELNKDRNATFTFDYEVVLPIAQNFGVTVEYLFSASYRDILIYDEDNNKIYGGYISEIQFNKGQNNKGTVTVSSKGFFSLLAKRFTNSSRTYSAQDISYIINDLITYTQGLTAGNFGITAPTVTTTRNMDRTYRYDNIKEAIEKMSNNERANAVDFDVNASKEFLIYYPTKGTQRDGIILEEDFNIETYNLRKIFVNGMANQVIVLGSGFDDTNQLVSVQDSEAVYKTNFFLLQDKLSEIDTDTQGELDNKGTKYITNYKAPRYVISLTCRYETPDWTTFVLGDRLRVRIPTYNINDFFRVIQRSCDHNGNVNLSFFSL